MVDGTIGCDRLLYLDVASLEPVESRLANRSKRCMNLFFLKNTDIQHVPAILSRRQPASALLIVEEAFEHVQPTASQTWCPRVHVFKTRHTACA